MTDNILHGQEMAVRFRIGLLASVAATATLNSAHAGEPHWVSDSLRLYVFDGSAMQYIGGRGSLVETTRATTTYTVLVTDEVVFCDTDGGAFTVTLPAGVEGQQFRLINCGGSANNLTISPDGSETIEGGASKVLTDGQSCFLTYNATEGWW